MSTDLTGEEQAVSELAAQVLGDHAEGGRDNQDCWAALARTGLLGLALPDTAGGSDRGLADFCLVMFWAGRHLSTEPLWPTVCALGMPVAAFGYGDGRSLLRNIASGVVRAGAALVEGPTGEWESPLTAVHAQGSDWVVDGVKTYAHVPDGVTDLVVSATGEDGQGRLVLVDPRDPGVNLEFVELTGGRRVAKVELRAATAVLPPFGGAAEDVLAWTMPRVLLANCAYHAGVARSALELTASYLRTREQFGRPLAAFQAVAMRAADAYMDADAMWTTTWAAAQAVDTASATAPLDVSVANAFGRSAGARVLAAAQHLHGGLGVDVTYPLHRYFLASKRAQLAFGTSARHLDALGEALVVPAIVRTRHRSHS